jgi:hypothetical protein
VLAAQPGQLAGLKVGGRGAVDLRVHRPRLVRGTVVAGQRVDVQLHNGGCALAQRRAQAVVAGTWIHSIRLPSCVISTEGQACVA